MSDRQSARNYLLKYVTPRAEAEGLMVDAVRHNLYKEMGGYWRARLGGIPSNDNTGRFIYIPNDPTKPCYVSDELAYGASLTFFVQMVHVTGGGGTFNNTTFAGSCLKGFIDSGTLNLFVPKVKYVKKRLTADIPKKTVKEHPVKNTKKRLTADKPKKTVEEQPVTTVPGALPAAGNNDTVVTDQSSGGPLLDIAPQIDIHKERAMPPKKRRVVVPDFSITARGLTIAITLDDQRPTTHGPTVYDDVQPVKRYRNV